MPFSGTVAIRAMKDGDYQATVFAGTTAGLQSAIDYLAGGKGEVRIGPGTLEITTVISLHSGTRIIGSGAGATMIKRASGSILSGDPAASGNTFINSAVGANGTLRTTTGDSDIEVADMTLDGNYSAFGSVTFGSNNHLGIRLAFVDRVRLRNLKVQNYMMSGIEMNECRNTLTTDVYIYTVGQYGSATSRNGLDFLNNAGSASGYSTNHLVENVIVDTCTDAAFHIKCNTKLTYKNLEVKGGGKYAFELESTDAVGPDGVMDVTISNVVASSVNLHFFSALLAAGTSLQDILVQGCTVDFDATHANNAVAILRDLDAYFQNVVFSSCIFRGCNTADATGKPFFLASPTSATASQRLIIEKCIFQGGLPSSTKTNCHGILLSGNIKDWSIRDCFLNDIPGDGIAAIPNASNYTITRGHIAGCNVNNVNNDGIQVLCNTGTGNTVSDITIDDCIISDSCQQTGSAGVRVGTDAASNTATNITVSKCRPRKVSAASMTTGFRVAGAGTTDSIYLFDNDHTNLATPYTASGSPTNLHFQPRVGRGTDITAAATIAIPTDGDVFHVLGNTNVTNGITVSTLDNGRRIVLIFEGTPTVSDTGTSKLAGNFVAAGTTNDFDTLTLVCDGTNWTEVARSTN